MACTALLFAVLDVQHRHAPLFPQMPASSQRKTLRAESGKVYVTGHY